MSTSLAPVVVNTSLRSSGQPHTVVVSETLLALLCDRSFLAGGRIASTGYHKCSLLYPVLSSDNLKKKFIASHSLIKMAD